MGLIIFGAVLLIIALAVILVSRRSAAGADDGPRAAAAPPGRRRAAGLPDRLLPVLDRAAVVDVEEHHDLVAAQRVEPLGPGGRRRGQLTPVPGVAVVVEDDLAVEVFQAGHQSTS